MVEKMGKLDRYIEVVWKVVKKDTENEGGVPQKVPQKEKGIGRFWLTPCFIGGGERIEPLNKGFADLCLTTWLRRKIINIFHFRDWRFPLLSGMFLIHFFHIPVNDENRMELQTVRGKAAKTEVLTLLSPIERYARDTRFRVKAASCSVKVLILSSSFEFPPVWPDSYAVA